MKKHIIILFSLILLIYAASGCAPKPASTLKELLETLKRGEYDKVTNLVISQDRGIKLEETNDNKISQELYKRIFSKLKYEILSSSTDGDKGTVKLKTTNLDMEKISQEALTEIFSMSLANAFTNQNQELSDEQTLQAYTKRMDDPAAQTVTMQTDIDLQKDKENNKWKVVGNDKFINAVTGNMAKTFKSTNDNNKQNEPAEDPNAVGSRSNPVKLGETGTLNVLKYTNNRNNNYQLNLVVKEVIRGSKAWDMLIAENRFNDPPPEGKEYMLVRVQASVPEADTAEEPLAVSEYDFNFVSAKGNTYPDTSVVTPNELSAKLYKGGTDEGITTSLVDIGDAVLMMYDGMNKKLWFSLQ